MLPGFRLITYNGASVVDDSPNTTNKIIKITASPIDTADNCKLYYNTGTASTPVWVEITNVYT